jgi:N4-gp56 family major capsid protein
MFNLKTEFKDALADWMKEILEQDTIYALSGLANPAATISANEPSTNRKWYGGQTTAGVVSSVADDASIDSSTNHLFGPEVISVIKRKAIMSSPKIRPVKLGSDEMYVMFIHPYQTKSLVACDNWINAQLHAANKGPSNPIFKGADYLGTWDGVALYEHDGILRKLNTGSQYFESGDVVGIDGVARALFCGAQAGVIGYGQYPGWYEKNFEYNRVPGVATDVIYGIGKPEFDSEDFGVITVDTAAVADS